MRGDFNVGLMTLLFAICFCGCCVFVGFAHIRLCGMVFGVCLRWVGVLVAGLVSRG